jgi:hypothetical protein
LSIFCFQIFLIICFCCGILHGKRCKLKLCERWCQIGIAKNIQVKIEIVTKVNGFMNFTFLQIMCITKFEIMIPNMSICVFVAIVQIHCCITTNYWQTKILDQLSCNVFVWKIFLFYKSFLVYVEVFFLWIQARVESEKVFNIKCSLSTFLWNTRFFIWNLWFQRNCKLNLALAFI